MSADALKKALRTRYAPPEWVLLEEVRSHTGHDTNPTYADAFAMSTYPGRGLQTIGFEVKVSRSDWLSELRKPDKADNIARYCDLWYVVIDDAAIVKLDEVPPNWGVLVYKTSRFRVLKEAVSQVSVPISREFVAALLRKATRDETKYVHVDEVDRRVRDIVLEREAASAAYAEKQAEISDRRFAEYTQYNEEFLDLVSTNTGGIVSLLKQHTWLREVLVAAHADSHRDMVVRRVEREADVLRRTIRAFDVALAALTQTEKPHSHE